MVQIRSRGGGEKDRKHRRKRRGKGRTGMEVYTTLSTGLNLTGRFITPHYPLSLIYSNNNMIFMNAKLSFIIFQKQMGLI